VKCFSMPPHNNSVVWVLVSSWISQLIKSDGLQIKECRIPGCSTFPVWARRGESHSVHWSESVRRMIISKLCSSADYQHQGPFLLLHHPCALKCCSIIVIFIFYETFYTAYIPWNIMEYSCSYLKHFTRHCLLPIFSLFLEIWITSESNSLCSFIYIYIYIYIYKVEVFLCAC